MEIYLKALDREIILLKKLGYSKNDIKKIILKKVDRHFSKIFHETKNAKTFYMYLKVKYKL